MERVNIYAGFYGCSPLPSVVHLTVIDKVFCSYVVSLCLDSLKLSLSLYLPSWNLTQFPIASSNLPVPQSPPWWHLPRNTLTTSLSNSQLAPAHTACSWSLQDVLDCPTADEFWTIATTLHTLARRSADTVVRHFRRVLSSSMRNRNAEAVFFSFIYGFLFHYRPNGRRRLWRLLKRLSHECRPG